MASPKIVLFIVEGRTDELALGRVLSKLVGDSSGCGVKFGITRGDITSSYVFGEEPSSSTIKKRVQSTVRSFLERDKLSWNDLSSIILITDTDGAFVEDALVWFNQEEPSLRYFNDHIETGDASSLRRRNKCKSSCLKVLVSTHFMTYARRKVPFRVAYMSRNLEHALSDYAQEASTEKKVELARRFTGNYGLNTSEFLELLAEIAPPGTYQDSWNYIFDQSNSLKRGSNMKQVLDELVSDYEIVDRTVNMQ